MIQFESSSCVKNKSNVPQETVSNTVGPGIPRGDPSKDGAFPVSAKVKTAAIKSSVHPDQDPDNLGEHAVGMPQGPSHKFQRGPRLTSKDVEDVYDDCGADFDSLD